MSRKKRKVNRDAKIDIGLEMNIHRHIMADKRNEIVEPSAWRSDPGYLGDVDDTWRQPHIGEWLSAAPIHMRPEPFDKEATDGNWFRSL